MKSNKMKEFQYHVPRKDQAYFEGWYYKIHQTSFQCAIIIGLHQVDQKTVGFIQFLRDGQTELIYETYQADEITITMNPFQCRMKDNIFTEKQLTLHLEKHHIHGNVHTGSWTPLVNTRFMPTIMGPFAYLKMECNHALISLYHKVKGELVINQETHIIDAVGYMEKDWGTSFPKTYIWYQSNMLHCHNSSFFLAVAHIPIAMTSFTGVICELMVEGKQRRFASYLGARVKKQIIEQSDQEVIAELEIQQGCYTLQIIIKQCAVATLLAPKHGQMNLKIHESLNSDAELRILKHQHVIETYHMIDGCCEIVGHEIVTKHQK